MKIDDEKEEGEEEPVIDGVEDGEDIDYKKIAETLSIYIPMIAIFSNEIPCSNLQECIETIIKNVEGFETFCQGYQGEEHDTLGCYMKLIRGFSREDFLDSMIKLKKLMGNRNSNVSSNMVALNHALIIIYDTIVEAMGNKDKLITHMTAREIQDKIIEYLPVKKVEKDKYGEVFTPQELINEMLDKLPTNVWSDPNLKWLDPANGIGNFPMLVFERLNEGLKTVSGYEDEKKRKEHIIKNMLYMVELNGKNIDVSRKIFGKSANIYHGSFLEDGWKDAFKIDKFDVIVGNPPFNNSQENDGKKGGGEPLWDKFVINSIDLLKQNGLLLFVHPSFWRKPSSEHSKSSGLFDLMAKDNYLHYLEIHDAVDGKKVFNANTRYDFYVLEKTPNNGKNTNVKDQQGNKHKLNLLEWEFLPNHSYNVIKSLLGNSDNIIFSRNQFGTDKVWVNKERTTTFKYPLIHSTTKTEGIKMYYTNTKRPDVRNHVDMFGVSKVIFGETGIYNAIIDIDGNYGMTQQSMGIKINSVSEGIKLKNILESKTFKMVLDACSWSNYRIDWRLFNYFKPDFYEYVLLDNISSKSSTKKTKTKSKPHSKTKSKPPIKTDTQKPKTRKLKINKKTRKLRRILLKKREKK